MPMTLTVSRNRKTSHNYNSDGCGLSLTVELDQGLLHETDELHSKIERLYAELDHALEVESERSAFTGLARTQDYADRNDSPHRSGITRDRHGRHNHDRDRHRNDEPAMTHSQRRAIGAIAKRLDVDPEDEARDVAGTSLDVLTLKQASSLIDRLKSMQHANGNGNGSRTNGRSAAKGGAH